jgi:RNA recognition motif-containing protein
MPDLVGLKRKAESQLAAAEANDEETTTPASADAGTNNNKRPKKGSVVSDRLFLSRLPLTATKTKLSDLLGGAEIKVLHWLTDKNTGGFYGSCIVQLASEEDAETVVDRPSLKMEKKKVKVTYYNKTGKDDEECCWPPDNLVDQEYPPIGS